MKKIYLMSLFFICFSLADATEEQPKPEEQNKSEEQLKNEEIEISTETMSLTSMPQDGAQLIILEPNDEWCYLQDNDLYIKFKNISHKGKKPATVTFFSEPNVYMEVTWGGNAPAAPSMPGFPSAPPAMSGSNAGNQVERIEYENIYLLSEDETKQLEERQQKAQSQQPVNQPGQQQMLNQLRPQMPLPGQPQQPAAQINQMQQLQQLKPQVQLPNQQPQTQPAQQQNPAQSSQQPIQQQQKTITPTQNPTQTNPQSQPNPAAVQQK